MAVAGLDGLDVRNETILELASKKVVPSSSGAIHAAKSSDIDGITGSADLDKRSSNIIRLS